MFRENMTVLSFPLIDAGNASATNALSKSIVAPCDGIIHRVVAACPLPLGNSATVTVDHISGNSTTANIAVIVLPDTTGAGAGLYDDAPNGRQVKAGDVLLLDVAEAGDVGEFICVSVLMEYDPEAVGNQDNLTVTA